MRSHAHAHVGVSCSYVCARVCVCIPECVYMHGCERVYVCMNVGMSTYVCARGCE